MVWCETTQCISYWAGNWQINHSNYGMDRMGVGGINSSCCNTLQIVKTALNLNSFPAFKIVPMTWNLIGVNIQLLDHEPPYIRLIIIIVFSNNFLCSSSLTMFGCNFQAHFLILCKLLYPLSINISTFIIICICNNSFATPFPL